MKINRTFIQSAQAWLSLLAISISFATFVSTVFLLAWSIHEFQELLPKEQALVIFAEPDIKISPELVDDKEADKIEATIRNIGQSIARDVRFRIYEVPIKLKEKPFFIEHFDDYIVHDLPSGGSATFGRIWIFHKTLQGVDLKEEGRQLALIYHLEYIDNLTNQRQNQYSIFQYQIGKSKVTSMIGDDFKKIVGILELNLINSDNNDLYNWIKSKKLGK